LLILYDGFGHELGTDAPLFDCWHALDGPSDR
jgi:hypothetical protein